MSSEAALGPEAVAPSTAYSFRQLEAPARPPGGDARRQSADLELLSAASTQLRAELGGIDQLSVQADRRVGRGGVLARTDEGEIDAIVDAQLTRAREIVAAELERGEDPGRAE